MAYFKSLLVKLLRFERISVVSALVPLAVAIALSLSSCSHRGDASADATVPVVSLYDDLRGFGDMDSASRAAVMDADRPELAAFMATVSGEPVDEGTVESWAASKAVEIFTPSVDSVFRPGHTAPILGRILSKARDKGIELPARRYAEVVYGRPESVLFVDSVMLIALNHYLGADYPGYSHLPAYMRLNKRPEILPFDLAEALAATQYPFDSTRGKTLLSRMLYEGSLTHIKMLLTGSNDEALALGYTPGQYKWLKDNEALIWKALISRRLLFDTSAATVSRLVDPAPTSSDVAPEAPGRLGRFVGYQLVKSYLKGGGEKTPIYMLSSELYADPSILDKIKYNP